PGDAMPRLMGLINQGKPPPPMTLRASIADDLQTLILDAMAKDREKRIANVEELAKRLHPFASAHVSLPPSASQDDALAETNVAGDAALATTALASVRASSAISPPEKTSGPRRPWMMAAI